MFHLATLFMSIHIVTNGKTSYFVVELYEFFCIFWVLAFIRYNIYK